jgi:transposase
MGEIKYLMSQKQITRYTVISNFINGEITRSEAAERLSLSERQIIRLKKGVIKEGVAFLQHKNTGRKPIHAIDDKMAEKIASLKQSELYRDAIFLHFQELLEEHEGIVISYTPLYNILTRAGIQSPKKRRRKKKHNRRKRREREGSLIQMDATPYEWFGGNEKFDLHGAIDDATGKVVGLYMTKHECLHGYLEITRQMLLKHGIPVNIYADRHTIFRSPKADKLALEEQLEGKQVKLTQFQRAMDELGVVIIPARSPQAKGRVERLWETLQSRLPVEFKIAGITTVEEANEFLINYIDKFNEKYAVAPENPETAFRSLRDTVDIDNILCVKVNRCTDNGSIFSYANKHFMVICEDKEVIIPPRASVDVLISTRFGIRAMYKGKAFDVIPYVRPKRKQKAPLKTRKVYRPPDDHYFKYGHELWTKLSYAESNDEIMEMLEDIFLKKYA